MTRDDLAEALQSDQMQGFLRVIRAGESNQSPDAYFLLNGGGRFTRTADHPFAGQSAPPGKAAGAYQFIPHTWARLASEYGLPDFSPNSQDLGAAGLIMESGAWPYIEHGDLATAIAKLESIWVSLPQLGLALAQKVFTQYGGSLSEPQASPQTAPEPPTTTAAPQQPTSMPFLALLPLIAQFVPQIMTLLKPTSQSTAKDAAVAGTILNTVVQAAGIVGEDGKPAPVNAATVGQAAEKMAADPALAKTVQQAVVTHPDVLPLLEVGGGVAAARQADLAQQQAEKPFWKASAVFWMSLILVPMIYWYVGSSILGGVTIPDAWPWYAQFPLKLFGVSWDSGARVGLANLVVGLVLGGICGVYYGVSVTQQRQQGQTPTASESSS